MNKAIINRILYLTHDKWNPNKVKYREEFKNFLELCFKHNELIQDEMLVMLEYSENNEVVVPYKGVMNIIESKFPETYDFVCLRIHISNNKKNDKSNILD